MRGALKDNFNTVCFTETPLTQIRRLVAVNEKRKIELKPYGLVFWKDALFKKGASPAVYINAEATNIDKFLLNQFEQVFTDVRTRKELIRAEAEHYREILRYYSLINVVKPKHDFMWEREWRHHGDFKFEYNNIVAIIAEEPEEFEKLCKQSLAVELCEYIGRLPIIDPDWNYEQLVEELTVRLWTNSGGNAS